MLQTVFQNFKFFGFYAILDFEIYKSPGRHKFQIMPWPAFYGFLKGKWPILGRFHQGVFFAKINISLVISLFVALLGLSQIFQVNSNFYVFSGVIDPF